MNRYSQVVMTGKDQVLLESMGLNQKERSI
jgi:hypothetical protein